MSAPDVLLAAPIRFAKSQKVPSRIADGDSKGALIMDAGRASGAGRLAVR
jgi:hypothetical protein